MQEQRPPRKTAIECEGISVLKALEKRPASLLMTNFEILIVYDLVAEQQNSTIFFFQWQPKTKLTKLIPLSWVREVQKRRFLG